MEDSATLGSDMSASWLLRGDAIRYLHPWITENLLIKAGTPPRNTSQDGAYRFIYTSLYEGTIEDCNVYLRSQGLKEFTRSDRAS